MTTYSEDDIRKAILALTAKYDLEWEEFLRRGSDDDLLDLSPDLDFAYRALVPLLSEPSAA